MDKTKRAPGRCIIMINKFGKDSKLYIKAKVTNGVTMLEDSFFTAPYKIAKPFFDDTKGIMNIMVMAASAGIMEGDCYRINIELGDSSRVALHGQSYNKIHRMKEGYASQFNKFLLGKGAFFDYVQKPTIPFARSRFYSISECHLKRSSAFLYSEVFACGREKRGERFEFKEYKSCNKVYYNGELIFLDNQLLLPDCQRLEGIGFFEGYTHQATLAFFCDNFNYRLLDRFYELLKNIHGIDYGLTTIKRFGTIIRMLGNSSDFLERILINLRDEIYNVITE